LKFNLKKITETNPLPEYNLAIDGDVVIFTRKTPPKEKSAPKAAMKRITQAEIEKHARPGESYAQAAERLRGLRGKL
jgi:hypothetical protein